MMPDEQLIDQICELVDQHNKAITARTRYATMRELEQFVIQHLGERSARIVVTLVSMNQPISYNLFAGDQVSGDKIENKIRGNVTGSSLGSGDVMAYNIQAINTASSSSGISDEMKGLIDAAIEQIRLAELEPDEREDASTYLKRIAEALEKKDEAKPGMVKRTVEKLVEIFKGAGAVATLASAVGKIFGWL